MNENTAPIPQVLASFLSLSAEKQLAYFETPIPTWRSNPDNVLGRLLNVTAIYLPGFFDLCDVPNAENLLGHLNEVIRALSGSQADSLDDFLNGEAWEELRRIARKMIEAAGTSACEVPMPLPLREWSYHYYGDS